MKMLRSFNHAEVNDSEVKEKDVEAEIIAEDTSL